MAGESGIFGINSGFDSAELIDNLVLLQRRPIDLTIAKRDVDQAKLAVFQDLKNRLQIFKTTATNLNTDSKFLSTAGSFANNSSTDNNSVVDISTTSQAIEGDFSLVVESLAKAGKVVSNGFSSLTSTIPHGTFEIMVGSTRTLIEVNSTNDTLDELRLAINNSGADVQASFLNDGDSTNPIRLIISGKSTGADNSISADLFQTNLGTGPLSSSDLAFTSTQTAQDAIIQVDGISINKSSNTIDDVIQGTTLNLQTAGSGTVSLASNFTAIKENIDSFVQDYNDTINFLKELLSFDPDTNETGVLFGNFTVQNLQSTLRNSITSQVTGTTGTFEFLSQIGITTEADGTLTVDDAELTDALEEDVNSVSELFASKGTTTSSNVTFVGFTSETVAGTYDLRVLNGTPQLSVSGANNFTDATGSGTFFAGAEGTDAEGLNFRIDTTTDGNFGTINLSLGVAEVIKRELTKLTDASLQGPLVAETTTFTNSIKDFDNTIDRKSVV